MNPEVIKRQIPYCLKETNFNIGTVYHGKVRDNYILDDKRIIITTDRISAFDRIIGALPFKGEILQSISNFWFSMTDDIIDNHILDTPDPNVVIVKNCEVIPVELIVRRYITGSLWREYEKGNKNIYGIQFPDNLKKNDKFEEPIVTPTTKAEHGEHDMPISPAEIIEKNLVDKNVWEELVDISIKLFKRGEEIAEDRGLVLVDTKYEFGIYNNKIVLIDEIHTPDSSRYWYKESVINNEFKQLDKEYVRQWLIEHNFMGDGPIPELPEDVIVEAVKRYLEIYRTFLKKEPIPYIGNVIERIEQKLKNYGLLK